MWFIFKSIVVIFSCLRGVWIKNNNDNNNLGSSEKKNIRFYISKEWEVELNIIKSLRYKD